MLDSHMYMDLRANDSSDVSWSSRTLVHLGLLLILPYQLQVVFKNAILDCHMLLEIYISLFIWPFMNGCNLKFHFDTCLSMNSHFFLVHSFMYWLQWLYWLSSFLSILCEKICSLLAVASWNPYILGKSDFGFWLWALLPCAPPYFIPGKLEDNGSSGGSHSDSTCINPCKIVCAHDTWSAWDSGCSLFKFLFSEAFCTWFLKVFVCFTKWLFIMRQIQVQCSNFPRQFLSSLGDESPKYLSYLTFCTI